jgi:hypothetical protein
MIQFNLLPDVKLAFIRAQRLKRIVIAISSLIAIATLSVALTLASIVYGVQKKHMDNLSKDITRDSKKLQDTPDLNKILTIQNQLNNLTPLHEQKAAVSRFKTYITQLTPTEVRYAEIEVNIPDKKIVFTGSADSLKTVNQFIDTLKFTTYTARVSKDDDPTKGKAFPDVVLSDFGRDDRGAKFEVTASIDPIIFDGTQIVSLTVPNIISTRSVTERPGTPTNNLFQPLSDPDKKEGGQGQ